MISIIIQYYINLPQRRNDIHQSSSSTTRVNVGVEATPHHLAPGVRRVCLVLAPPLPLGGMEGGLKAWRRTTT